MVEEHATWSYIAEMFLWTTWWGWIGDLTIDNLVQALAHLAEAALGQVVTFYILLHIRLLGRASANVFFRLAICWFFFKEKTAEMYTNLLFWLLKICFFWRLPFYVMMMKSLNIMKMIEQLMLSWDERW